MATTETYEQSKSRWGFDVNLVRRANYEDLEFDFTGPNYLLTPVTSTKVAIELIPLPGFHYPVVQARGKANIVIAKQVDTSCECGHGLGTRKHEGLERTNNLHKDKHGYHRR